MTVDYGQEVKGFRLYLLDAEEKVIPVASWHQLQDAEKFHQDLAVVARRIEPSKVRIALLGDGANWLWSATVNCFPDGRQILDFYHCSEHVHAVARAQYGEGTLDGQQWTEATLIRLCMANVKPSLPGCPACGQPMAKPRKKSAS